MISPLCLLVRCSPPPLCRPKIQRLVTPLWLQHRRHFRSLKHRRLDRTPIRVRPSSFPVIPFPSLSDFFTSVPSSRNALPRKKGKSGGAEGLTQGMRISCHGCAMLLLPGDSIYICCILCSYAISEYAAASYTNDMLSMHSMHLSCS